MKLSEISKSKERKVGVVLSYLQIAISSVGTLLYTPIMLRLIGKNEYGLYGTVTSFVGLLSLLTLGFSSSYIKFYSNYKIKNEQEKINSFNSLFFIVFAIIAMLAVIIGGFFSFNLTLVFDKGLTDNEYLKARIMMILLTLSTAFGFLVTVFNCYVGAHQKFIFTKSLSILSTLLTFLINLIVLKFGFGAVGLVVVSLSLNIIYQVIIIIYSYTKLDFKFDFKHIDKGQFKKVFVFSGLIAINLIVDKINTGIDSILLGRFCGTATVAVYTIGASLNSHFSSFSAAISGVFTPKIHELVNSYEMDSKEQRIVLTDFFVKVGRIQYLLMALLASGVVFFGKPFIKYWAGEGYDDAYYIAIIMILPSIISLTQNVGIEIQRAENRHHYRSYIYGFMALGNLLLSIYLCQIWGGIGSAIGTSVACIFATIIAMNIVYYKKINIDIKQYWKNIARQTLGMLIPFVIGTLIMKFVTIDSILKLAVWIAVYTIVYLIFVVFLSTNNYEKELIKSVLRKIKLIK
jgi:O-antigen/teichoic acid export membrane protein